MKNTQKKFNMYVPKSRLAYVDTLTDELLEDFSLSDVADYEVEYDANITVLKKEDMDNIFSPEEEGEPTERNLQEEGPLHSKEDILKSMWSNND